MSILHPATFPEKLAEDHILSWSNPGDVVLDPMCGSGTTCKMAIKHQRQYIGIDISKKYCELTKKRLDKFMKQITIFKDKNLYSSFPLLDYISDNEIVTGFFIAPRPDHCGIYDWRVMLSTDQGETWTETHDKKYKFNDTEFRPRYLSDSFKTQDGRVGSFGFAFSRKGLQMSNCISISKNNNFSKTSRF